MATNKSKQPALRAKQRRSCGINETAALCPEPPSALAVLPFHQAAEVVLGRLQSALVALLKAAPGKPRKPAEVERALGLDYKLSWQIHRIATEPNPLAAGSHVPARVSMQRLLKSATRADVSGVITGEIAAAFDEFEKLVETEAHDREELDAMLATFVPESREKVELAAKGGAFKAQSQLKGVTMEAQVGAFIIHPSSDPSMADRATFSAYVGLRRLRADAYIGFSTISAAASSSPVLTLDRTVADGTHSILLEQFCSDPVPQFDVKRFGSTASYEVAGANVGLRSAVDLVMAEYRPAAMRRHVLADGKRMTGVMNLPDMPMKRQVTDIFLNKDVYPGSQPEFGVYDTVPRGLVGRLNDPERERDRLAFHESMQMLPGGMMKAHCDALGGYVDMLTHICAKLGWDPSAFRGYRLDVAYPMYGAQYMIGFPLADPTGG